MSIELEISRIISLHNMLEEKGYDRAESLCIIQTAAISKLSKCVGENYHGQSVIKIHGSIATYEQ